MEVDVSGDDDYNNTLSWRDQNFRIQQKMLWHDGFQKEATPAINDFYSTLNDIKNLAKKLKLKKPKIFFSYSWPILEEPDETWIQQSLVKLYKHFKLAGFDPKLDLLDSKVGYPADEFMLASKLADWVILAFSRTFQEKMKRLRPMLKKEMDMHNDRWQDEVEKKKEQDGNFQSAIIPCLFSGKYRKSAPYGWQGDQACEILRDKSYAGNFFHLVGLFYGLSNNNTFKNIINQFFEQHSTHTAPLSGERIQAYIEQEKKLALEQARIEAGSWAKSFAEDQKYQKTISAFWSQNIQLAACFPEKAHTLFSRSVWSIQRTAIEQNDNSACSSASIKVNKRLPNITSKFVPRPGIMHDLLEALEVRHAKAPAQPRVIVSGIGGAGKTQLALYAIHQYGQFAKQLRWWFPSETIKTLESAYANFATDIGIVSGNEKLPPSSVCERVKYWLENNPGWFIVYDNIPDHKSIQQFLPKKGGQILITSRCSDWPEEEFSLIKVDTMEEHAAINLLRRITKYNDTDDKFKELAQELGYLAKALAHAAAYIKQCHISISAYLDLYQKSFLEALGPIVTTWDMSINAIKQAAMKKNEQSYALDILIICSYLNPDNIPQEVLKNCLHNQIKSRANKEREGDDHADNDKPNYADYYKAQAELLNHHLIEVDRHNNTISLHRVIHKAIRIRHQKQLADKPNKLNYFYHIAESLIDQFAQGDDVVEDEIRRKNLLSHSETFMHYYDRYYQNQDNHLSIAELLDSIAITKFYLLGDAVPARILLRRSLRIREQVHQGQKTEDTAITIANLANTEGALGDPVTKRSLLEESLDMLEHCMEEGFRRIINKLRAADNNMALETCANWIKELKDTPSPLVTDEVRRIALENTETFCIQNQLKIGRYVFNLANAYGTLCELEKAKYLLELGIDILKSFYSEGYNHPQVAHSSIHLAYIYAAPFKLKGFFFNIYFWWNKRELEANLAKAESMLTSSLEAHQHMFNNAHRIVALASMRLSWVYKFQDKHEERHTLLKNALNIQVERYGKNSLRLVETYELLIDTCISLQDLHLARDYYGTALRIIRQQAGGAHAYTKNLREQFSDTLYPQSTTYDCLFRWCRQSSYKKHDPASLDNQHTTNGDSENASSMSIESSDHLSAAAAMAEQRM